jgi:hypothetical protein
VELSLCNERLATDALQLIRSLGFKASMRPGPAKIYGRVVGIRYRITFTAREPVFRLPAKLQKQRLGDAKRVGGRQHWKAITAIEPIESCQARCITVDSSDHTYLCTEAFTVTHNTSSIIIGRALHSLGRDPSKRIIVLSKTYGQAEKIVRTMRALIDHSEELHQVFPDLKPGNKWTDGQFTVQRPYISKTPSVQALGFRGAITGARVDELYVDDLEDDENTRTPHRRADTLRWIETTVLNRLTRRGRVVWTTNAWHPKDTAHTLGKRKGWTLMRYPVESKGRLLFPQRYSRERVDKLKEDLTPLRFAQVYLNDAREESVGEFQPEAINKAKALGRGLTFLERCATDGALRGASIVTGVDLATGRMRAGKRYGDLTAMVTILRYPNNQRQILNIESGRWQGPEILLRLCDVYDRYGGVVIVEDNQAQVYLHQFADALRSDGLEMPPLFPWSTGSNKWDPSFGVASIAIEMSRGQWAFPSAEPPGRIGCPVEELVCHPEIDALAQDMLDFGAGHTGDRLMGLWFAREGLRRMRGPLEIATPPTTPWQREKQVISPKRGRVQGY